MAKLWNEIDESCLIFKCIICYNLFSNLFKDSHDMSISVNDFAFLCLHLPLGGMENMDWFEIGIQ